MDILHLRLFVSIARTLNFSRTAEQYCITQPAVSHSIRRLEAELGVKLLKRTSHDVSLTPEGEEFLICASQMLNTLSSTETRIKNMTQGYIGSIRVAALSCTSYQLCDCLSKLYDSNPRIQTDIDLLESAELARALNYGDHDFYFTVLPMMRANSEYSFSIIHRGSLKLFVNSNIADSIDVNDWATLEQHPFISPPQSDTALLRQVKRLCRNRGINPRIVNYYERAESVVLAVASGIGLTILPEELSRLYQRPNVVTLPINGNDAVVTYVFAWKKYAKSAVTKTFKDIVLSAYPG